MDAGHAALLLGLWVGAGAVGLVAVRRVSERRRIRERLGLGMAPAGAAPGAADVDEPPERLDRWLWLAGLRDPDAPRAFVLRALCAAAAGAVLGLLLRASGVVEIGEASLAEIPGGVGDLLIPVVWLSPWLVFVCVALLPFVAVQRRRRLRVERIEADLPITLDLLATLAESGLGFESAVARVEESQGADRPLVEELRTYRGEILGGLPRVRCLRRLSRRVSIPACGAVVSALVQAEQIGAALAEVLRRQAEDLRARRREQALARAQVLSAKLVFPLVVCFLPGIVLAALGPAFHRFASTADSVIERSR